jgi:hypothetical protein
MLGVKGLSLDLVGSTSCELPIRNAEVEQQLDRKEMRIGYWKIFQVGRRHKLDITQNGSAIYGGRQHNIKPDPA